MPRCWAPGSASLGVPWTLARPVHACVSCAWLMTPPEMLANSPHIEQSPGEPTFEECSSPLAGAVGDGDVPVVLDIGSDGKALAKLVHHRRAHRAAELGAPSGPLQLEGELVSSSRLSGGSCTSAFQKLHVTLKRRARHACLREGGRERASEQASEWRARKQSRNKVGDRERGPVIEAGQRERYVAIVRPGVVQ